MLSFLGYLPDTWYMPMHDVSSITAQVIRWSIDQGNLTLVSGLLSALAEPISRRLRVHSRAFRDRFECVY